MSVTRNRARQIAESVPPELHDTDCMYIGHWSDQICTCYVLNHHPESVDQGKLFGRGGKRIDTLPWFLQWWFA